MLCRTFAGARANVRGFWLLIFIGALLWLASLALWSIFEVWFRQPDPDLPAVDILLFVKLVPLTAAFALDPHTRHDSRTRTFGLLDVSILMIYSLYLYAFYVFAYRLLPGFAETYNYHFNLTDAIGNKIFSLAAAFYIFRAQGPWRWMFRIYSLRPPFMDLVPISAMSPSIRAATIRELYVFRWLLPSLPSCVSVYWAGRFCATRPHAIPPSRSLRNYTSRTCSTRHIRPCSSLSQRRS